MPGRQTKTAVTTCKVCGSSARYSFFGAIVCSSCKVFFKRNASNGKILLKCHGGNRCEVSITSRGLCRACRLAKCFTSGMMSEMIRSPHTEQMKSRGKEESSVVKAAERNRSDQISTSNSFQVDHDLVNLIHCFDDHGGIRCTQHFIDSQNALPPKLRFKYLPVKHFFTSMMSEVQLKFERHRDCLSLSLDDRSILLRSTVENTTSVGVAFILKQARLFHHPAFIQSAQSIFRPAAVALTKRVIDQLDADPILMNIMLAVMAFVISPYTTYRDVPPETLKNVKTILHTQGFYTELAWRCLLSKYNQRDAISYFSNFTRYLLLMINSSAEAHEERQYTDIIDSVIETTEIKMNYKRCL